MPRTARSAPGGVIFHVLKRGNARAPVFDSGADYAAFLRALAETLALFPGVRLLCYCLMPDHWHLVLWPTRDGELGAQKRGGVHVRPTAGPAATPAPSSWRVWRAAENALRGREYSMLAFHPYSTRRRCLLRRVSTYLGS